MSKTAAVCVGLLAVFATAAAQDNHTNTRYAINDLVLYSKSEPVHPLWAGYTSVTFTDSLEWSIPNVCNGSAVAIRPQDTHLLAAVQVAYASGQSVRLFVDDSQRLDSVCILRALQY